MTNRGEGREWPPPTDCETMIGLKGLDNLHCVTEILSNGGPGDLLEAGVWRGGHFHAGDPEGPR
jgi:O-methyltransferase